MPLPRLTLSGNLTRDPEIRFTPSGTAVATLRIASSDRKRDANGDWTNGEPCYLDVEVWKQAAERATESLRKGDGVIVSGRLRMKSYTKKDGTEVTAYIVEADDLAKALRGSTGQSRSTSTDDPWNDPAPF